MKLFSLFSWILRVIGTVLRCFKKKQISFFAIHWIKKCGLLNVNVISWCFSWEILKLNSFAFLFQRVYFNTQKVLECFRSSITHTKNNKGIFKQCQSWKIIQPYKTRLIPLSWLQSMKILYNYIETFYIFLPLYALSIHIQMIMNTVSKIILKPGVFTLTLGCL